jgi:SAM-dependent methyltransferase
MDGDGPDSGTKARAREQFSSLAEVWPSDDPWSQRTHSAIAGYLLRYYPLLVGDPENIRLLNIGSHGNDYGLAAREHIHVDLASNALTSVPLAVECDAELLPFASETIDVTICVGSVINYGSPPRMFSEIARVLKPQGYLFLEFETSDSFEFAMTRDFSRDVTLVKTFYNGVSDPIYVYSARYINSALAAAGLDTLAVERFHRLSTLIYRITKLERLSATFARFDRFMEKLPKIGNYSANVFLVAQK